METTYTYGGQPDFLQDSLQFNAAHAGFWLRFAAYIIDAVILFVAQTVVYWAAGLSMFDGSNLFASPVYYLVILGDMFYFALLESSQWQASLGKKAIGIVVTDLDGNRISFGRALGRYASKIISAITIGIGFLMIGFTEKKQGLHDMIAGTLVVKG